MTSAFGVKSCPCGSGAGFVECCAALHRGERVADTAQELMRSRYAAFATGDAAYLLRTWHPRTRPEALNLDPRHRWVGLRVLTTEAGELEDLHGVVTYRADSIAADGSGHTMTERARFERRGRRWVYVDGDVD